MDHFFKKIDGKPKKNNIVITLIFINMLSITEWLLYTTVRIECKLMDGSISTGTGFFFILNNESVIVTNKHVVNDYESINFILCAQKDDGFPDDNNFVQVVIRKDENHNNVFFHPEENVDLVMIRLKSKNVLHSNAYKPFFRAFQEGDLYVSGKFNLKAIEDVFMIGYPNGLWDSFNNKPIVRKGITATYPILDYNGNKEFLIDIAAFPGSSGSPVFILNDGMYSDGNGSTIVGGNRLILMGILYSGPIYVPDGSIGTINIPTVHMPIYKSQIPLNLGIVIKSEKILDFKQFIRN